MAAAKKHPQDVVGNASGTAPTSREVYTYLARAEMALSQSMSGIRRSRKCPECGDIIGRADGKHVLYMSYIVVGCKLYWVVDPNKIGIKRPGWEAAPNGRATEA